MRLQKGSELIVVSQFDLLPQSLPTEKLPLLRAIVISGFHIRGQKEKLTVYYYQPPHI